MRILAPESLRITRKEAADMLGISNRQFHRILKRFMEEGFEVLRNITGQKDRLTGFLKTLRKG
ncbi:MAG: helix-turn-helix domain-containing protein [Nitrososphaeria archaeon]